MSPLKKLHFGKKSLGLWLTLTKNNGSLIKAFNTSEIHTAYEHYPNEDFLSNNGSLQYFTTHTGTTASMVTYIFSTSLPKQLTPITY